MSGVLSKVANEVINRCCAEIDFTAIFTGGVETVSTALSEVCPAVSAHTYMITVVHQENIVFLLRRLRADCAIRHLVARDCFGAVL